jgi:hypothetical protein
MSKTVSITRAEIESRTSEECPSQTEKVFLCRPPRLVHAFCFPGPRAPKIQKIRCVITFISGIIAFICRDITNLVGQLMPSLHVIACALLVLLLCCLKWLFLSPVSASNKPVPSSSFRAFQRGYLLVYLLIMGSPFMLTI